METLKSSGLTGIEREVKEGVTIVSKTDLYGTITDCNDAFVEISGYRRDELIGQPHSILRHPDVPKAVFKDLWNTLQSGKPWVQLVKNRCANGDHYWVEANVSPILENNQVVGYLSVRRKITDAQKEAAQQAYAQIEAGKLTLKNGVIETLPMRLCLLNHFNPLAILTTIILVMGIAGILNAFQLMVMPLVVQVTFLVVVSSFALFVTHRINQLIRQDIELIEQISQADFSGQLVTYGQSWVARLASGLKRMQIQMGADYDATRLQMNHSHRIEVALDSASTNMMVTDVHNHIIFVNQALYTFLKSAEQKIQAELPHFEADHLIGQSIDVFHKNPQHQVKMLSELTELLSVEINLAGYIIELNVQPVVNAKGERIGTVAEWVDLTSQRHIESTLERAKRSYRFTIEYRRFKRFLSKNYPRF